MDSTDRVVDWPQVGLLVVEWDQTEADVYVTQEMSQL